VVGAGAGLRKDHLGLRCKARKALVFEKRNKKLLLLRCNDLTRTGFTLRATQQAKSFGSFFSKKNYVSFLL
jgi:hypothetical protein